MLYISNCIAHYRTHASHTSFPPSCLILRHLILTLILCHPFWLVILLTTESNALVRSCGRGPRASAAVLGHMRACLLHMTEKCCCSCLRSSAHSCTSDTLGVSKSWSTSCTTFSYRLASLARRSRWMRISLICREIRLHPVTL